jgi:hypothetical protein
MDAHDILIETHSRIRPAVHAVLEGADEDLLAARLDPDGNSVGWLVWHLTRVQDDHVSEVAGHEQTWTAGGFAAQAGLPFPDSATGYGFDAGQVGQLRIGADLLRRYHDAVADRTHEDLRGLSDADLDRVVDDAWDPPVTLGVRLVSTSGRRPSCGARCSGAETPGPAGTTKPPPPGDR